MIRRRELQPALQGSDEVSLNQLLEHVRQWQADTLATADSLEESKRLVQEHARRLENPQAAIQLAEFFMDFFVRMAAEFDRLLREVPGGPERDHVAALNRIAAEASAEERRAVVFRDRWVNKPLPYEDMRAVLDRLSAAARDQLVDYRVLAHAAARLLTFVPPEAADSSGIDQSSRAFDRRELFSKFIPKRDEPA